MSSAVAQGRKRISFVDPASFTPHFSWEKPKAVGRFSGDKLNRGAAVLRPYRELHVHCEDISLSEIADKVGTPAYVYSQAAIGDAYRELDRGLGALPHTLCGSQFSRQCENFRLVRPGIALAYQDETEAEVCSIS